MTADAKPTTRANDSVYARFMLGFEDTTLPSEISEYLGRGLAGVALYSRNYRSLAELQELTDAIHAAARQPVLIGIDQEGGSRFALPPPFTEWPSPEALGQLADENAIEAVAHAMAVELRAAGCNLNFAPMLDLHTNPKSPVTKDRSFGADPHHVARMGMAFHRGLAKGGVLSCAKHFPGHGDAAVDPHLDLPVFNGSLERLDSAELVPFLAACAENVPSVMTAHILLPKIDVERPASLSRFMLHDVLRGRMKFGGVIFADDLGMGAIAKRFPAGQASIETIRAGTDIVMLCHDASAAAPAISAVNEAYKNGLFDETEWQASAARIELMRGQTNINSERPPLEAVGCTEHRELSEKVRARAINRRG